jgi:acyl-CoA synthetase (AMP-forming)/AMP-acid ligase II
MRVVDFVRKWADRAPNRKCLFFYGRDEAVDEVTYDTLWREAMAWTACFRHRGLRPGDPVILIAHPARPFVSAFLAAQHSGLLAVPCPPVEPLETARRVRERMTEILDRCKARAVVDPLPGRARNDLGIEFVEEGLLFMTPAELGDSDAASESVPETAKTCPFAFCQFTSGSGGRAKGVLLTHENLAANIGALAAVRGLGDTDVGAGWLSLFHDMGLINQVLMPLVVGFPSHIMSPLAFLAKPGAWLSLLTHVRGTFSAAPNFAYALCARKVPDQDLATLDLTEWRIAVNGAEPVTQFATEAFIHRFEPCGFRRAAFLPSYGLAEATLCVTMRRPGEGPRFEELSRLPLERDRVARPEAPGQPVASVGRPIPGQELAIVDGDGVPVGERQVGEILVRGASVMHGYLGGMEGESTLGPDGWLRTGDLGYLADGELFIVGRKKDVIIRAGLNYSPQDLEEAACGVPGARPGRAVAFSLPGPDTERVILAVECVASRDGDPERLRAAIREAVYGVVRFFPDEVLLLAPRTLPLTTSGKLMRPESKRLYLEEWGKGV